MTRSPNPGTNAPVPRPEARTDSRAIPWLVLLGTALVLPVRTTAVWLNATYDATPAEVQQGIWMFKAAVVAVCVAGIVLSRVDGRGPASATRESSGGRAAWGAILAIAVVALVLRLYGLDAELWLDEIEMLARYMPLELRQLVSTYDTQNHHPLYGILAHLSWSIAGGADWTIRLPAVLFGVASVVSIQRFALRLVAPVEATLTALVLAVSYHHVWFSQNARGYTAILFFAIAGTASFLDLLAPRAPRPARRAWTYALLMALATYTHLTAALVAGGHALALLLTADWRSREGRARMGWPLAALALSGLLTICLYAPMLPQVVRELGEPGMQAVEVEWTSARWMLMEGVRSLAAGVPGGLAALLVALVVLGAGLTSLWKESRAALLAMFLPVLVTAAALVGTGHNLWPRFFFFAAGFFVLAAIRGGFAMVRWVVKWRPDRVAAVGATAVALLSLVTVPRAWQPKQQFRAALEFVERERAAEDEAVALDVAYYVYLMRGWAPTWYLTNRPTLLAEIERRAGRTWVVYTLPTHIRSLMPELWERISPPRYQTVRVFPSTVGGGEIHVLRREPSLRNE